MHSLTLLCSYGDPDRQGEANTLFIGRRIAISDTDNVDGLDIGAECHDRREASEESRIKNPHIIKGLLPCTNVRGMNHGHYPIHQLKFPN